MPATIRWQRHVALTIAVLTAFVLAVSLLSAPAADAATKRQRKIHSALQVAHNQKGDPYRYGANGPASFDCSGLVYFAFRRAGFRMPRTSGQQANRVRRIRKRNMRRGDLMFFHNGGRVYHVGIFTGWDGHRRRRVLHSPRPGSRVHVQKVWTRQWYAGTLRRR
jgi:cell wall-associated NlpC family hydrolase